MKQLIGILPYSEVQFKFISNHFDIHLSGSCVYNKSLCEFKNKYPEFNEASDEFEEMNVEIYKLTWKDKLKWIWKQWLFEKCVGCHWSYKNGKRGKDFYYRNSFHKWLFKKYYNL